MCEWVVPCEGGGRDEGRPRKCGCECECECELIGGCKCGERGRRGNPVLSKDLTASPPPARDEEDGVAIPPDALAPRTASTKARTTVSIPLASSRTVFATSRGPFASSVSCISAGASRLRRSGCDITSSEPVAVVVVVAAVAVVVILRADDEGVARWVVNTCATRASCVPKEAVQVRHSQRRGFVIR